MPRVYFNDFRKAVAATRLTSLIFGFCTAFWTEETMVCCWAGVSV